MVDPILTPILLAFLKGVASETPKLATGWIETRRQIRVEYTRAALARELEDQRYQHEVHLHLLRSGAAPRSWAETSLRRRLDARGVPTVLLSPAGGARRGSRSPRRAR